MHLFICWSGRRSRRVAEALERQWLPALFGDRVTTFVSFSDIEKGERWFDRLMAELDRAEAAIVCLTPENLASPWMHFEAGMVSRMERGRVFTYYLGPDAGPIQDPLKQVQVTVATKADTGHLATSLAQLGGISSDEVEPRIEPAWSVLVEALREVGTPQMDDVFGGFSKLFERKTFNERLEDCADQLWHKRFEGTLETRRALVERQPAVLAAVAPWQAWIYNKVIRHVDAYADALRTHLLIDRSFDFDSRGRVDFTRRRPIELDGTPPNLSEICERRCREIRHAVFCLSSPDGAPVLADALAFSQLHLNQFEDKKRLIHAKGPRITRSSLGLHSDADLERCARSMWDYDRIMYYKARESEPIAAPLLLDLASQELERARADEDGSRMPLHYAVKTLAKTVRGSTDGLDRDEAGRVLRDIEAFLNSSGSTTNDPDLRHNVADVRQTLGIL